MSTSPNGGFCVRCGAPSTADGRFCARCGSPSGGAPAPVGIPYAAPPKRSHHGALIGVLVVLLLVLIGVLAATVPVNQTVSTSATIVDPGSLPTYTDTVFLTHVGTFTFAWATTNGGTTSVTVQDPTGSTLYSPGSASSGQGSFPVNLTGGYTFAIYDWSPETVQLSGTLHYTAPLI